MARRAEAGSRGGLQGGPRAGAKLPYVLSQGPAYKMSDTPPRVKWALRPVGADNEYIYGKLCGLSKTEIEKLEAEEVI